MNQVVKSVLLIMTGAVLGQVVMKYGFEAPAHSSTSKTDQVQSLSTFSEKNRLEPSALSSLSAQAQPVSVQQVQTDNAELIKLKSELAKLKDELQRYRHEVELRKQAAKELAKARKFGDKINDINKNTQAKTDGKPWADEAIDAQYPPLISKFMKSTEGYYRKIYQEFQHEPIEPEWASSLELKIRDFVTMHEYSHAIEIINLTCRTYRCELGLKVLDPSARPSKRIFDDMSLEPWFRFFQHHRSPILSQDFVEEGTYFFMVGVPDIAE